MPNLHMNGITIDVSTFDVPFYKKAGYVEVEEPGEIPAPEKPKLTREEKAALKAGKQVDTPPDTEPLNDPEKAGDE